MLLAFDAISAASFPLLFQKTHTSMKYFLVLFPFLFATPVLAQPEGVKVQPDSVLFFGQTLDMHGDYAMVWKSIPNKNTLLVYKRENDLWSLVQELEKPHGDVSQVFGNAVDMNADRIVTAGPFYDYNGALNAGIVYIFEKSGDSWTNTASITPDDIQGQDEFGFSVGIDGDVIIAGSPRDDNRATNAGSAYIFRNEAGVWIQEALLEPDDGLGVGFLGRAVAISGDYAIAGAPGELGEFAPVGSAYIFERTGDGWAQAARLEAATPSIVETFGQAVEIQGEIAMVGAIGADGITTNTGAVYVYQRINNEWQFVQKIFASDGEPSGAFGAAIVFEGNCAVIGSYGAGNTTGGVYFFRNTGMTWEEVGKLTEPGGMVGNSFGSDVGLSNGHVLVGSTTSAGATPASFGAAYFYDDACAAFIATSNEEELPISSEPTLLMGNYPNPFQQETTIVYHLTASEHVELSVFNTLGQRVRTLTAGLQAAGTYNITWDRRSDDGAFVSKGIYFSTLKINGQIKRATPMVAW